MADSPGLSTVLSRFACSLKCVRRAADELHLNPLLLFFFFKDSL